MVNKKSGATSAYLDAEAQESGISRSELVERYARTLPKARCNAD
jgi:hypothetical protein